MNAVTEYFASLRDDLGRTGGLVLHVGLPVAVGAIALAPSAAPAYRSQIITVVAIVSGLLFSMLVLLIDLRGRIRRGEDRRAVPGDRDSLNLDYAYYTTHYAILLGFALAGLLLAQEQLASLLPDTVGLATNWILYALAVEFALAVLHCLKRLRRCYEVFGKGNV